MLPGLALLLLLLAQLHCRAAAEQQQGMLGRRQRMPSPLHCRALLWRRRRQPPAAAVLQTGQSRLCLELLLLLLLLLPVQRGRLAAPAWLVLTPAELVPQTGQTQLLEATCAAPGTGTHQAA
jgi:hypothetical protein